MPIQVGTIISQDYMDREEPLASNGFAVDAPPGFVSVAPFLSRINCCCFAGESFSLSLDAYLVSNILSMMDCT